MGRAAAGIVKTCVLPRNRQRPDTICAEATQPRMNGGVASDLFGTVSEAMCDVKAAGFIDAGYYLSVPLGYDN